MFAVRGAVCAGREESLTAGDLLPDQFLGPEHRLQGIDTGPAENDQWHVGPSPAVAKLLEHIEQVAAFPEPGSELRGSCACGCSSPAEALRAGCLAWIRLAASPRMVRARLAPPRHLSRSSWRDSWEHGLRARPPFAPTELTRILHGLRAG